MKKFILILAFLLVFPIYSFAMTALIEWQPSTVNSPKTISYYNVYQYETSGGYLKAGTIIRKVTAPKTAIQISGLLMKNYYWVITAVDDTGKESLISSEVTSRWFIVLANYSKYIPTYVKYWNNE